MYAEQFCNRSRFYPPAAAAAGHKPVVRIQQQHRQAGRQQTHRHTCMQSSFATDLDSILVAAAAAGLKPVVRIQQQHRQVGSRHIDSSK